MEDKKVNIKFTIMAVLLIIIFCAAIAPITLQNDTFYTIKIGEHIMDSGITEMDPFSWHEDLKYTFPHWGYDAIIYLIYSVGGMLGVYISTIIFTSILGLSIYFINVKLTKRRVIAFILTIGAIYLMKDYIAARAQLLTYILFVLEIFGIEKFLETKQKRYAILLIIIPALIANLHAAVFWFYFVLYLPYIGEYVVYLVSTSNIIGCKFRINRLNKKLKATKNSEDISKLNNKLLEAEKRKEELLQRKEKADKKAYKVIIKKNDNTKWLIVIMLICLFTGLLTPIGSEPYVHLVNLMSGESTQNISEHLPLTLVQNVNFICVLIIFFAILMFTDTKIKLSDLFMLGGLLVLTFYSRRQESMFIIACVFILNRLISSMFDKYDPEGTNKLEALMTKLAGQIIVICVVLIMSLQIFKPKKGNPYIDETKYPVAASDYIIENLDVQNIKLYNEYNFGSYLIYRNIPVFIDSRADLYTPEFNKDRAIFKDFLAISNLNIPNIDETLEKYGITHLIMNSNAKLRIFLDEKPEDYREIYDDDKFCIYEEIKGN